MMSLSPEEKHTLDNIASNVSDIHADMADVKAKIIQHGADIRSHQWRLDRHDFRIGTLESHAGIGPVGAGNPMVDPVKRRSRTAPQSFPPKGPEDLGLEVTKSGTTWQTKDVNSFMRHWEEQEQQRLGAELALELERKNFDRRLKIVSAIAGLTVLIVGSLAAVVTFFWTHVRVLP